MPNLSGRSGRSPALPYPPLRVKAGFVLRDLSVQNDLDHMVINNRPALLVGIDEGLRTGPVYEAGDTGRKVINQLYGIL